MKAIFSLIAITLLIGLSVPSPLRADGLESQTSPSELSQSSDNASITQNALGALAALAVAGSISWSVYNLYWAQILEAAPVVAQLPARLMALRALLPHAL